MLGTGENGDFGVVEATSSSVDQLRHIDDSFFHNLYVFLPVYLAYRLVFSISLLRISLQFAAHSVTQYGFHVYFIPLITPAHLFNRSNRTSCAPMVYTSTDVKPASARASPSCFTVSSVS